MLDILLKNKDRLIDFLSKFQSDRKGNKLINIIDIHKSSALLKINFNITEEEQFHEEREYLIKQVKQLQPAPESPESAAAATAAAAAGQQEL